MKFPDGFLWGAATAAHQVEGNNVNCDSWLLEHVERSVFMERSGDACDHYHRYPEDVALLAMLGFNAYRFSIEWARIEPEEGEFSLAQLDHYRRMLATCKQHGLKTVVTIHHFTSPRWLAARGGWESPETARRFARYCERAVEHLGDLIDVACTLNELNLGILLQQWGFLHIDDAILKAPFRAAAAAACGVDPESFSSFPFCVRSRSRDVLLEAHRLGADALRAGRGRFPVGMTLAMTDMQPAAGGEDAQRRARYQAEGIFLEAARRDDFIGVQTYTRQRFGPQGPLGPQPGVELTQMGYEFWPEALEATIRYAYQQAKVPVIVTENGLATDDDQRRIAYLQRALAGVTRCLSDGIDIRGYFYWSALDNFEWIFGYAPKFGLIAVDRESQRRTVKPSASWLGNIARANEF
ncbi:MAG TPA: family 1 glycosylhydrolase [Candidatus Binataceae bacterium]|nr:family 1 glycosylhydrolase [Candidatus Binataceae bacterium]